MTYASPICGLPQSRAAHRIAREERMNFYDMAMGPLEALFLRGIRSEIIPLAHGNVLEVGIGTGANFPFYDYSKISNLTGLDCEYSPALARHTGVKFTFSAGNIEKMPFAAGSFDCAVVTLILCTVDIEKSLQEIKRVLKPNGLFIFIEHVRPSGKLAGAVFDAVNKVWPKMAHGCNLNRETDVQLEKSGFSNMHIKKKSGGIFCYGWAQNEG